MHLYINKIYLSFKIGKILIQKENISLRERSALSVKARGLIAGET